MANNTLNHLPYERRSGWTKLEPAIVTFKENQTGLVKLEERLLIGGRQVVFFDPPESPDTSGCPAGFTNVNGVCERVICPPGHVFKDGKCVPK